MPWVSLTVMIYSSLRFIYKLIYIKMLEITRHCLKDSKLEQKRITKSLENCLHLKVSSENILVLYSDNIMFPLFIY